MSTAVRPVALVALVMGAVLVASLPALAAVTRTDPMTVANSVGWLGGAFAVAINWPQAYRLWVTRQFAGLSPAATVMGLLVPLAWIAYGLSLPSTVQVVTNALVLVGAAAVLAGHVVVGRLSARTWAAPVAAGAAWLLLLAAAAAAGGAALGSVATLVTVYAALPQLGSLVRDRVNGVADARGVSLARVGLLLAAALSWLGYGLLARDAAVLVTNALLVALMIATWWLAAAGREPAYAPGT